MVNLHNSICKELKKVRKYLKVLILSASIGGGHQASAKALEAGILSRNSNSVVKVVDALGYVNSLLNKTVSDVYARIIKTAPKIYKIIYKQSDKDNKFSSLILLLNKIFSRKISPLLKSFEPNVIISTHMFPTEMVSYIKARGEINVPLICVITDYAPHKTWITKNVDAYIVASEKMIPRMIDAKVPEDKIHPFGIPVDDLFFKKESKSLILKELKLCANIPTILIMAGSFGVGKIVEIYNDLTESELKFQVVIITGKNKKLYEELNKLINEENLNKKNFKETKLIYFTNEVHKYMKVADLIITKPGGLTVSEALASELPMAVFDAIPGQEEENADFVIRNNMGVRINKNGNCRKIIEGLLTNKEYLKEMKKNCETYSKLMAKENVYELINKLAKNSNKKSCCTCN